MSEDCVQSIFLVVLRLLQQNFLHHYHATLVNVWTTRRAKDARTIVTKCWVTSTRRNIYNFDYESYSLAATGILNNKKLLFIRVNMLSWYVIMKYSSSLFPRQQQGITKNSAVWRFGESEAIHHGRDLSFMPIFSGTFYLTTGQQKRSITSYKLLLNGLAERMVQL